MRQHKVMKPSRPFRARLAMVAALVQAVGGWTLLLVVAGLAVRTRGAWIALAVVYPVGLVPLYLPVARRWRQDQPRG